MVREWLSEFRAMGQMAEQTRTLLCQPPRARALTREQRAQLDATLRHLAAVREGFQLSLRSGSAAPDELRAIVRHTLHVLDWAFLAELGLRLDESDEVQAVGAQGMAFAHATVALGMLPALPPREVSHPASSDYRDLHTPRRPGEWLERIEELEAVLTRLQIGLPTVPPPALRRTHAYFDASAWLVRAHLHRFGRD